LDKSWQSLLHGGVACDDNIALGLALQDHQKQDERLNGEKGDDENADINHRLDVLQNPVQCICLPLKDDEVEMS
jgi:hypothetical protein